MTIYIVPPDNTVMGLIEALGWEAPASEPADVCNIPPMTLQALAEHIKQRLGLNTIQMVGDPESTCKTVAIMPGFPPSEAQIGILGQPDVDVLITGEIHEWETSEYVRDAAHLGYKKGLIVTGHYASEEPGIKRMVPWLQERLPNISITHVPAGSAFHQI